LDAYWYYSCYFYRKSLKMGKFSRTLKPDFFARDTIEVAKDLLGKVLYRQIGQQVYRGIITETEAYHGETDLACHCSKGKTNRTGVMYDAPGHIYVYLIYGMYYMLNFVTMPKDFPAAVLIRGISNLQVSENGQTFQNLNIKTDGPGKLTKHLHIDKSLNALTLHPDTGLWVVDEQITIPKKQIISGKRIGIDYAKEWADIPWRFQVHPEYKISLKP